MKPGVREILGKTISKVVFMPKTSASPSKVYLFFADDTYYEFYAGPCEIEGASGVGYGDLSTLGCTLETPHAVYE